jgi:beta-hydroxylase
MPVDMTALSGITSTMAAAMVATNNRRVRAADGETANPRPLGRKPHHPPLVPPLDGVPGTRPLGPEWGHDHLVRTTRGRVARARPPAPGFGHDRLADRFDVIRAEWDAFATAGGRLPRIEQILGEHQGNDGAWRAGLLVAHGRPVPALAVQFPATVAALRWFPGLRSALWSVLEPGTELPEHAGRNAGVLRYHFGVVCEDDTALRVAGTVIPYCEGRGVLFDDTAPHAAWNRGSTARVTLFCEVLRPLPAPTSWLNRATQHLLALDHRYRLAPSRAGEWHAALNPGWPSADGPPQRRPTPRPASLASRSAVPGVARPTG